MPEQQGLTVNPADYGRWRRSRLGSLTERLEQEAVLRLSGSLAGRRVLDLGCGDGSYALLADKEGAFAVGLDISSGMLRAARGRAGAEAMRVIWCQASIDAIPFASDFFDIVVAVAVLCLSDDADAAVKEAARVLRPGGLLIIGELGKFSWWSLWRTVRGYLGSARWRHARFWSSRQLRRLVVEAGLAFDSSRGVIYYPPIAGMARIMVRYEERMSVFGQIGAAFLTVRAQKPG